MSQAICQKYYEAVPKELKANIAYRKKILAAAANNRYLQLDLWKACKLDPLFYINTFVFTYDPRLAFPKVPFVTYEFQDDAILRICNAIGKHDILIEKSRDMGASWICMVALQWRWQFYDYESFLFGSRKEEYVDKLGDLKSLFGKMDFIMESLPGWLKPRFNRKLLHLKNTNINTTIDGESTNDDFGRGDRRTAIFKDEFAAVQNSETVEKATRDATNCRIYNSTPQGTTGAFYEQREKKMREAPHHVIRLHWSVHPKKQIGLYTSERQGDKGPFTLKVIDEEFWNARPEQFKEYPFRLDGKLRSVWYDNQCLRATNEQEIAQELDIDYKGSAWQWWSQDKIDKLLTFCHEPKVIGELIFSKDDSLDTIFMKDAHGRLKCYIPIPDDSHVPFDQYVMGVDIATGTGGRLGSNSVASVFRSRDKTKVAQFATNAMSPESFADMVCEIGLFFHGAYMIPEVNGPGQQFIKRVLENKYPNVYMRRNLKKLKNQPTDQPGWHSDKDAKKYVLGKYGQDMMEGRTRNPCAESINEMSEYIHHPNGDIVHAKSESDNPSISGSNHGDMVIADALANFGCEDKQGQKRINHEKAFKPNQVGYRIEKAKQGERAHDSLGWEGDI